MSTDRGTRRQALHASGLDLDELDLLLDNVTDMVMLQDLDRTIVYVSPSVEGLLGWLPEDLVGRPGGMLWHPEDEPRAEDGRVVLRAGGSSRIRGRIARKGGGYRWVDIVGRPAMDDGGTIRGVVTVTRDAEDDVAAEQALRASEARYRLLAENASDVVLLAGTDAVITWISPSVRDLLDREPDTLLGARAADLVHDDDRDRVLRASKAVLRSVAVEHEARFARADGSWSWVSVRLRPIHDDTGAVVSCIGSWRDIEAEHAAREEIERRATYDDLTGLVNRAAARDQLRADLASARRRRDSRVGVLLVDLDRFKVVSDSLGHLAGDKVLVAIAERLRTAVGPDVHLARLGGDEFLVLVPRVTEVERLEALAAAVALEIATDLRVLGHRIVPSCSIGIAMSGPGATVDSLLRDADAAMHAAKRDGGGRHRVFDEVLHERAVARLTTEDELRRALEQDELVVHYQPIVRLADRAVVGHEALVRWRHPRRGLLLPDDFLGVAEQSGLVAELGAQVLAQVCAGLAAQPRRLGRVSVNVSPVQLLHRDWAAGVARTLLEQGVDPASVVIEVTETAVLSLIDSARDDLRQLRDLGIGLHVDDFGTGFSSISLLRDLPVTGVKLDRVFVTDLLERGGSGRALAEGVARLVGSLGLAGVAEGVETEEQAAILQAQGWTFGQGWLFGRPEPLDA